MTILHAIRNDNPTRRERFQKIALSAAECAGRLLVAWLCLALLVPAGAAAKPANQKIRSLGLIVAVGDACMFEHLSASRFQWLAPPQASFLEISDWGIDEAVENDISMLLGPGFRLQPIDVSHQDFDTWTYSSLARHIRELPVPEEPVDAYLLVLRDWRGDGIAHSDQLVGGLGLYRRDYSGGRERLGVFAAYRLLLADPDTGAVIAEAPGLSARGGLPFAPATRSLWPRTQNDLSPAQKRSLRSSFLKLIGETLPRALRQAGLPALQ